VTLRPLPQRQSLVAQTTSFLNAQIDSSEWREWLPSERSLCQLLQVSRNTLRSALAQLRKEGRIKAVHGAGNQITATISRARSPIARRRDVALLTPESIERLRPMQTVWIDEMRALLSERDIKLRVFHGPQYFGAHAGPALQKLVQRNAHGCWILMMAGEHVQRWFARHRVPAMVAGSTYAGIDLPFRDLDHRAICRHAAGVLLGLGHRRLAMLTPRSPRAGDLESEAGFREGVLQSRHGDARVVILQHDATKAGLMRTLDRLRKLESAPTAVLVMQPHFYLAAAGRLAQCGVRIPADMALISPHDDPFLEFVVPAPTRYVVNPHLMAKSLLRPVLELLAGDPVTQRTALIMPEFFRGESIAPAPTVVLQK
jgi:DNA-binding LacI/PurR family transcriptional regulator